MARAALCSGSIFSLFQAPWTNTIESNVMSLDDFELETRRRGFNGLKGRKRRQSKSFTLDGNRFSIWRLLLLLSPQGGIEDWQLIRCLNCTTCSRSELWITTSKFLLLFKCLIYESRRPLVDSPATQQVHIPELIQTSAWFAHERSDASLITHWACDVWSGLRNIDLCECGRKTPSGKLWLRIFFRSAFGNGTSIEIDARVAPNVQSWISINIDSGASEHFNLVLRSRPRCAMQSCNRSRRRMFMQLNQVANKCKV